MVPKSSGGSKGEKSEEVPKHAMKAMKAMPKAVAKGPTFREKGLCMLPRYVASRAYHKAKGDYVKKMLGKHGLKKLKEAKRSQRRKWILQGKVRARKAHAKVMERLAKGPAPDLD